MVKVKIKDIADELALSGKEVLAKAKEIELEVKNVQSSITPEDAGVLFEYITTGVNKNAKVEPPKPPESPKKAKLDLTKPIKRVSPVIKKEEAKEETPKEEEKEAPKEEIKIDADFEVNKFRKKKEEKELEEEKNNQEEKPKQAK